MTAQDKVLDGVDRLVTTCDRLMEISASDPGSDDIRTSWALEMGFIRLGEEVSRIPEDTRERFPGQPWRLIIDMRNLTAHQYDVFSTPRVRRAIAEDVPALRAYVRETMIPTLRRA